MMSESLYLPPREHKNETSGKDLFKLCPDEIVYELRKMPQEELKKYLCKSFLDLRNIAMVSYYEKWLPKKIQREVDEVAGEILSKYNESELPLGLETRFSPEEQKIIFENLFFLQPTFGCSKACPFCAWDAPGGVRDQMRPNQIRNLIVEIAKTGQRADLHLHFASEPSDYQTTDPKTGKTFSFKDLFDFAKKNELAASFITRGDDQDWLNFVVESNMPRSLDNATARRLQRQKEKHGGVKTIIHDRGGSEKLHTPGIGLSTKKTRELVGSTRGIYNRKPGIVMTPRGLYNMFPGEIQPDQPIGAPQGVLSVPLGELETGVEAEKILKPGSHLRDVMGQFLINKMFNTSLLPRRTRNEKSLYSFMAFPRQPDNSCYLVSYDPVSYRIVSSKKIAVSYKEFREYYSLLNNFENKSKEIEKGRKFLLTFFPDKEREIDIICFLTKMTSERDGQQKLLKIFWRFLKTRTKFFFAENAVIKEVLQDYMILTGINLRDKSDEEKCEEIEKIFPTFLETEEFTKLISNYGEGVIQKKQTTDQDDNLI